MLYACVQRFDVTGNLKNFAKFFGTKQGLGAKLHAMYTGTKHHHAADVMT
jgi:hypothetical protein